MSEHSRELELDFYSDEGVDTDDCYVWAIDLLDDEHDALLDLGWRKRDGRSGSGSGYSARADNGRRERLWFSPACLGYGEQLALDIEGVA